MKIWHKSLIALGTIGVISGSVAIGFAVGYKDYQYKKHFGRGSFSTAIPESMSDAPVYFASPRNSFERISGINKNDKTDSGSSSKDFAKSYLAQHGEQPLQIIEFAGTRFINEIPLYISTSTFANFVEWIYNKAEYGPEISSLDEIRLSGKTNENGTLGAFGTNFEKQDITYYVGQFFGGVKVASTYDYPVIAGFETLMANVNAGAPGLMVKLNRRTMTETDVIKFIREFNKANKTVPVKAKLYSVEKVNTIDGVNYYDIFLDNSHGILDKVKNLIPTMASNVSQKQLVLNADGTYSLGANSTKIASYSKISALDIMNVVGKIPNGISLDFLKYTFLHEYGHHQSNTSGSVNAAESPVLANGVDALSITKATAWTSIDAINEYFKARAPRLRAVRMNSLMHLAPVNAEPSAYPFIAIQYMVDPVTPGAAPTWKSLTPQEIFKLKNDYINLDEASAIVYKRKYDEIKAWADSVKLPIAQALILMNFDSFIKTAIPRKRVGDSAFTYKDRNGQLHILRNLSDASSPENAYKWATQFKLDTGDYIFDAPATNVASVTTAKRYVNYSDSPYLEYNGTGMAVSSTVPLYANKKELFKAVSGTETAPIHAPVPIPTVSTAAFDARKELLKSVIVNENGKYYLDETKMKEGDIFIKAMGKYLSSKKLDTTPPTGNQVTHNGITYTYVAKGATSLTIGGTTTPIMMGPQVGGYFDLSKITPSASGYSFYTPAFQPILPEKGAYPVAGGGYTVVPPTGRKTQLSFNTEADALNFMKQNMGLFVYSYLLNNALSIKDTREGNEVADIEHIFVGSTFQLEANNMKNLKVESALDPFGYELSFNEILTRDYVQMLFDETMVDPLNSNGLTARIPGLDTENPLAQGTPLNPSTIVEGFTDEYKSETKKSSASIKKVFEALRDMDDKELVKNTIFEAKGDPMFVSGILNDIYWGVFDSAAPIQSGNDIPGVMADLSTRFDLNWQMYDENRNPVHDTSIRIKDLDGTTVTDRVRAYWMYVLHQKGIYGRGGHDRTVTGIWHSKDKDAFYMWGYVPTGTKAKYLTFTAKDGTKKSFKLNFGDRLGYNQRQFDASSRKTLRDEGYIGWSIDYKTMGTYANADLTSGEYTATFTDENGNEVKKADGKPLFSMGDQKYVTNNNQFHAIATTLFEATSTDRVLFRVKDYF